MISNDYMILISKNRIEQLEKEIKELEEENKFLFQTCEELKYILDKITGIKEYVT